MPITEKRKETMMEYARKNLKRIPLDVQKEHYERIKAHAEERGETINGFIKRAIDEAMQRDNHAVTDCGGIKPGQPLPPSYYRGQTDIQPALDENGDIIPEEVG